MTEEIEQVKQSVDSIFDTVMNANNSQISNYVLVTFNDPDYILHAVTNDRVKFKTAASKVHIRYGIPECPELAMLGIRAALQDSLPQSMLYVFTDAAAKDYEDYEEIKSLAQRNQCQVTFLLTGDCGSRDSENYQVYYKLAEATSGDVFHLLKTDIHDILEYVKENAKGRTDIIAQQTFPPGDNNKFKVPVDSKVDAFMAAFVGKNTTLKTITDPDGNPADYHNIVHKDEATIVKVPDPKPGDYVAVFGSKHETKAKAVARSAVTFEYGFSENIPEDLSETATTPAADGKTILSILLNGDGVELETAKLLDLSGNVISEYPLHLLHNGTKFYITNTSFDPPHGIFKIAVHGFDVVKKTPIIRTSTPIERQNPALVKAVDVAPTVEIKGKTDITTDYNAPIEIKCKVHGYPKPDIVWQDKDTGSLLPHTVSTIDAPYDYMSFLKIDKLTKNSTYVCKAENSRGVNIKYVTANPIVYFNILESPEDETRIKYNEEGYIRCKVDAQPPASITWYKDGLLLTNKTHNRIVISEDMTTVIIKQMDLKSQGKFYCEPRNEINKKAFFTLVNIPGLAKPKITKLVEELRVREGGNVELNCTCTGYPTPTIRWYFQHQDDNVFRDKKEITQSILLTNITANDIGVYRCNAKNDMGADFYAIKLILEYPPVIKDNLKKISAKEGDEVIIPCDVIGEPRPKVKWLQNGKELHNTKDMLITSNGLKFTSISLSSKGKYTCKAENEVGSSEKEVPVDVYGPVDITVPKETTIITTVGLNVALLCEANGYPTPEIEWTYNSFDDKLGTVDLPSKSAALVIPTVQLKDQGIYLCEAKNEFGSKYLMYNVTVYDPPEIQTVLPKTLTYVKGEKTVLIACQASGNPTPTIKWTKDGQNIAIGTEWYDVEDGTLIIRNIDEVSQGSYECLAENVAGNDTAKYDVIVNAKPQIQNLYPSKTFTPINGAAELRIECKASGNPEPTITWKKDGANIAAGSEHYDISNGTLIIKNIDDTLAGKYKCAAENIIGNDTLTYEVDVYVLPKIQDVPLNRTITYKEGEPKELIECQATGNPKPTIYWIKDGQNMATDAEWYGTEDGTLIIRNVVKKSEGSYVCTAINAAGIDTVQYDVIVNVAPKIHDMYPNRTFTPIKGSTELKIECQASGTPEPTISWKKDGVSIIPGSNHYDITNGALIIKNIDESLAGKYECLAENIIGYDKVPYDVDVFVLPEIINLPSNKTFTYVEGEPKVLIECQVTGNPKPTVFWTKDGQNIASDSTKYQVEEGTLILRDIDKKASEGSYTCVAINVAGKDSVQYDIIVHVPPKILNEYPNKTFTPIKGDAELRIKCEASGYPEPTITWKKDGVNIVSGSDHYDIIDGVLIIKNIDEILAGSYECSAINIVTTDTVTYDVNVYVPANIDEPKVSSIETTINEDQILNCGAHGNPSPEIKWFYHDLNNETSTELSEKTMSLHLHNLQMKDQGYYQCIATNNLGSTSITYKVTVNALPEIERKHKKETFTPLRGDPELKIECKAKGNPEPTITWKKDDSDITPGTVYDVQGGVLIIKNIDEKSGGLYVCLARNKLGNDTEKYNVIVSVPPYIEKAESTVEKMVGQHLELKCLAHGTPEPDIQWFHNGRKIRSNSARLTFLLVQLTDQGSYKCVARNAVGSADMDYNVYVNAPPSMNNKYTSKTFYPVNGDLVLKIKCQATGSPPPTFVWKKDNLTIVPGTDQYDVEDGTLIVKNINEQSKGTYICLAQNKIGKDSDSYDVVVREFPPAPYTVKSEQIVEIGTSANIMCNISHDTTDSVRWYKKNKLIAKGELTLTNAQSGDSDIYSCRVSGTQWSRTAHVRVKVGNKPRFTTTEEENVNFVEGDSVRLICSATQKPKTKEKLKVTWKHNGNKIKGERMFYNLKMALDKKGTYTCEVSNSFGTISRSFNIGSQDCMLDTKHDFLTGNQPVMLTMSKNWAPFQPKDGYITMKKKEILLLHCPSGFNNIPSRNTVNATCEGDDNFEANGQIYALRDIKCNAEVEPTVHHTNRPCSNGNTEYVNVGYNVENQFINVYDVCLDKDNNVPLHTRHELSPAQYGVSQNTSNWFKHSLLPFEFDTMYNCENQITDINLFQSYDGCCFDRRQLVNPKDLQPGVPTTAAFTYLNVVPHWSTCNSKNWAEVEERVRNLSKSLGKKLTITTGTAEPLPSQSFSKAIMLHDNRDAKQPVAKYLWKIVQDESSSVAIIQTNVPGLSPADADLYLKCFDVCDQIAWMKGTNWHNTADGYTYCCSIQNFEKGFNYSGLFNDGKTTLLSEPLSVDSSHSVSKV
ncbi:hemicentin-1-like isoform X2 [Anticarsia gemmatalis]|uniref:hemicentin-1-like isoform X2 n=1 Tax=Anticarsia gemmatalis TaxID=129554 RepID=UPI003F770EA8